MDGATRREELADRSPDGMLLQAEGRIVSANRAAARMLGAERPDDLVGRMVLDFVDPISRWDVERKLAAVNGGAGTTLRDCWHFLRTDGSPVDLDVMAISSEGGAEARATHLTLRDPARGTDGSRTRPVDLEQLRELVKNIPIPTYVWRLVADDFVLVDRNESAMALTHEGVPTQLGVSASRLYAGQPEAREFLTRCAEAQGAPRREMQRHFTTAGGQAKTFLVSGRFVPPDLVVVHTDDITQWREIEEALRVRDWAMESSINAIAMADLEGRLTYVNPSFCRMWGYESGAEVLGRPVAEFWCSLEQAQGVQRVVRERGSWMGELAARKKSGAVFDVHLSASVVTDENGRPICLMASFVDITQEKRMTEELRQLGDFNAKLLQVANVWIDVLDERGNALLWNEEAERISGYSRGEVVGHDRWWEWIYPDPAYRMEIRRKRREAMLEGKPFWGVESTVRTRAGEERVMSWYGRTLFGSDGKVWALAVVGHDVTERKRSEQSLREYAVQVAQLNKEKTRFLSTASHELRTPLTAIRGFADLLAREEGLRPPHREMLARIRAQAERLDALLSDLLTLSRGELDRSRPSRSPTELGAVLERVVEVVKPQFALKGHQFAYEAGSVPLLVDADEKDLEQVLVNALANAIFYTPPGGRVSVSLRELDELVQVEVADTGIGISPQERERVFEEFYRTEAAKRVKKDGTGLGLSIVKRLVEGWGGSVWVVSPGDGQGTRLCFTVPRS